MPVRLNTKKTMKLAKMDREPIIVEEEVAWAMRQLPNKKAPGIDRIPAATSETSASQDHHSLVPRDMVHL